MIDDKMNDEMNGKIYCVKILMIDDMMNKEIDQIQ
jgi:hypothetical protein